MLRAPASGCGAGGLRPGRGKRLPHIPHTWYYPSVSKAFSWIGVRERERGFISPCLSPRWWRGECGWRRLLRRSLPRSEISL